MTDPARATGNWSAIGRRHAMPEHRGVGRSPESVTVPGRMARALTGIVLAVAATVFAIGPASPAADSPVTCTGADVPFTAEGLPLTMHGTLCVPNRPTDTVVLLVPGASYNHVYWDFPLQPHRYSFRLGLNLAGLATFVVDRLGTGLSARPLSTAVTGAAQSAGIHASVQLLRTGGIGGATFSKVIVGGHSQGSLEVLGAVATYPQDADGVLITGYMHLFDLAVIGRILDSFYPANLDPAFAQAQPPYDDGYLTTKPGTREANFYAPATADPAVIALDEATKDVVTTTEMNNNVSYNDPSVSQAIHVPVMVVLGEFDPLFLCTPSGPPCSVSSVLAQESAFYSPQACLQAFVLNDAGHSLNLFPNAHKAWKAVAKWANKFVSNGPSLTCP